LRSLRPAEHASKAVQRSLITVLTPLAIYVGIVAVWTCLAAVRRLDGRLPVWAGSALGKGFVAQAPLPLKLLVTAITVTVRCRPAAGGQARTGGAARSIRTAGRVCVCVIMCL
jgi:hypothetical protein